MPNSLAAFNQPKAVIISIGIGTFRDGEVPAVKYARHDAEVMAEYLRIIGGVPGERYGSCSTDRLSNGIWKTRLSDGFGRRWTEKPLSMCFLPDEHW